MDLCCDLSRKQKHLSTFLWVKLVHLLSKVILVLKASKGKVSQKSDALLKPYLKTAPKTILQEATPWVTQILNHVIVWMVLYCAQKLLGWKKNAKTHSLAILLGKLVQWLVHYISIGLLCCFYGVDMGFTMAFYDILCYFHGIPIGILWQGFPWCSYDISLGLLWDLNRISMVFLWVFFWIQFV